MDARQTETRTLIIKLGFKNKKEQEHQVNSGLQIQSGRRPTFQETREQASKQALFSLSLSSSYEVDEQQSALLGLYEAFGPVEVAAHNETHIS
jgi:hypothetical protein